MVKAGFNADYGLFTSTEQGGLAFPQPVSSQLGGSAPVLLHFLGAIFGKALYEGILLDTPLAPFFVAKLQGRYPLFDDLQAFDPELHRSLVQLKRWVLLEPACRCTSLEAAGHCICWGQHGCSHALLALSSHEWNAPGSILSMVHVVSDIGRVPIR